MRLKDAIYQRLVGVVQRQPNPIKRRVQNIALKVYARTMSNMISRPSEIAPGQTAAVALGLEKTAALCYDRVWSIGGDVPDAVRFGLTTDYEVEILSSMIATAVVADGVAEHFGDDTPPFMTASIMTQLGVDPFKQKEVILGKDSALIDDIPLEERGQLIETTGSIIMSRLAASYSTDRRVHVLPIYSSRLAMNWDFGTGSTSSSILATIAHLEVVDEEQLTWDNVLAFRADKENAARYRRFLHWLDRDMAGKSPEFIKEEMEERLEDYEFALKQADIKTRIGLLSSLVDPKTFALGTAAGAWVAGQGFPAIGALLSGVTIGGNVVVNVTQTKLTIADELRNAGKEIAWVHELRSSSYLDS